MAKVFESVFRPGRIGTLELPHRIIMGSMHLGIESSRSGQALAAFYAERARGGAALIISGGIAVNRTGAGGRSYSFVNESVDSDALSQVVRAVHRESGRIALQLFHAGRYGSNEFFGIQPVAPSAVPSRFSNCVPRQMTEEDIAQTIAEFATGAWRARELGFDAVEIMGSEGYLLNQFLSPLTNRREDHWGGDAKRRMRFPIAVVRAMRATLGREFPVIYRLSVADLMPQSTTAAETHAFARVLMGEGVDALDLGVGWHESSIPTVQYTVEPGAWIGHAAKLKEAVGSVPVIAGTRIDTLELAQRVLAARQADFISMARPFLADPAIIAKSRSRPAERINYCVACNQACIDQSLRDRRVSCMVNPRAGRELQWPEQRSSAAQGVFAVVGGGPAGLEAARVLAALGHQVVLYEAQAVLGGQLRLAARVPGKHMFARTIEYFEEQLKRLGVELRLGRRIEASAVAELADAYDGVVVASGVVPRSIALPGANGASVYAYPEALAANTGEDGPVAVIGAGGIGLDVAHLLSTQGRAVTLMCRGPTAGGFVGRSTRWALLRELRERGVNILTRVAYESIEPQGVRFTDQDGVPQFVSADRTVIAAGQERSDELSEGLRRSGVRIRVVGGARDTHQVDAVRAFREGAEAAHDLGTAGAPKAPCGPAAGVSRGTR